MKTTTLVFPEKQHFKNIHFGILIYVLSCNTYFRLLRKKTRTENKQLFDDIIDITLFDGVEGLD